MFWMNADLETLGLWVINLHGQSNLLMVLVFGSNLIELWVLRIGFLCFLPIVLCIWSVGLLIINLF